MSARTPTLLLRTDSLPDGDRRLHELTLDGYRAKRRRIEGAQKKRWAEWRKQNRAW